MSLADYRIHYSGGLVGGAPSARMFGELGVTAARIVVNAGGEDYAEITVDTGVGAPGMPFLPLARHDIYAPGGTAPVFTGWLLQLSRQATAGRQRQTYRLDGPMSLLAGVPFQQPWAFADNTASTASTLGHQTLSRVILNLGTVTVAAQITQIWEWFATQASGPVLGSLADAPVLAALKPPEDEQADLSCAECLRRQLRWCPQVTARWEYGGAGGPALRFSAYGAVPAAAVGTGAGAVPVPPGAASVPCGDGGIVIDATGGRVTQFRSTARYDLLLREVTILRVGEAEAADADGGTVTWLTRSPDTSAAENGSPRRMIYTCKLRGASNLAPAEQPPPDGLAAAVHAPFKELTHSLQWTVADAGVDWDTSPGQAVGVRNAGDPLLAGSRAIIQRIIRDLAAGTTAYEAGPPASLNFGDLPGLGRLVNPTRNAVRNDPGGGPGEQSSGSRDGRGGGGGSHGGGTAPPPDDGSDPTGPSLRWWTVAVNGEVRYSQLWSTAPQAELPTGARGAESLLNGRPAMRVFYPFGAFPFVVERCVAGGAPLVNLPETNGIVGAPFGLTLAQMMRWYWRVKRWNAHLEVNATRAAFMDPTTGEAVPAASVNIVADQVFGFSQGGRYGLQGDESMLVLPIQYRPMQGLDDCTASNTGAGTGSIHGVEIECNLISLNSDPPDFPEAEGIYLDAEANLFYPRIGIYVYVGTGEDDIDEGGMVDGHAPGYFTLTMFPQAEGEPSFPLQIDIDGLPTQTVADGVCAAFGPANTADTCTATLTVTALEYWPYQNAAGVALYDTATGAPLA